MKHRSVARILDRTVAKFATRAPIGEHDRKAFYQLPFEVRQVPAHRYIVR